MAKNMIFSDSPKNAVDGNGVAARTTFNSEVKLPPSSLMVKKPELTLIRWLIYTIMEPAEL